MRAASAASWPPEELPATNTTDVVEFWEERTGHAKLYELTGLMAT